MSSENSSIEFWLSRLGEHLKQERYAPRTAEAGVFVARDFLGYLSDRHIAVEKVQPGDITLYLQHVQRRRHRRDSIGRRNSYTVNINRFLRLVHGHWPPPSFPDTPAGNFQREVCREYEEWMANVRGWSPTGRYNRAAEARRFLSWLGERGTAQGLTNITANDIDAYALLRAKLLRRTTLRSRASDLRNFLRYLHTTGRLLFELSRSVIIPRLYQFGSVPSALRAEEIVALVEATRRDHSPKGLRDFAILTLLSVYGLRAGEVTSLRLEDMEWRTDKLRVRHSKTSVCSELPLLPAVGNAILNYLRKGRPKTQAREVFIRTCAPYRAFKSGSSLHRMISLRFKAAGLEPQSRRGPHAFRHARAISLLEAGVPLKEISDVLGHRSADSARTYLNLANEDLRSVALEIPMEVRA